MVMRGVALLWRAMRSPFICGFEHVDSKCGHVSMVLLGHSVQLGFEYKLGQTMCLRWLPIYCAYQNFRVCVIWASTVPGFFKIWLESLWFIWSLDVHLSMYVNLDCASLNSWFLCTLLMYVCRFRIAPVWMPMWNPIEPIRCSMDCMYHVCLGRFVQKSSIICQLICYFITYYACVCSDFLNCDFMREPCYMIDYSGYEQFVWVVMLR